MLNRFTEHKLIDYLPPFSRFIFGIFIGLAINVNSGESCMPGYEAERAKLRQYLGIEWTPHGLDKMNDQKVKPVRHAHDLNCDFSQPQRCHWQNVENDASLDTLDFHLFRKEDHTEFPVIQVRPGPSKVAMGEQMIFVGDRRRDEQSAMLASWPIRCQNSTGRLTFTFWIYNGASIEVLILEEEPKTRKLRISPEKQHVDCGTVTVNTECTVEVPPRDTPFRIGIRAFDMKNPDGSFVLIDNIFYEAQFCKVSIDFGSDFRTEELVTAEEGELIQASSQLSCHDFGPNCRWRNGGHNERSVWRRGLTSPPNALLFNETGTYTAPNAPFAFMYIEEEISPLDEITPKAGSQTSLNAFSTANASEKGEKLLVSDPILCQSPTNPAIISFRIWATRGIEVSICALDLKMVELDCQQISLARSPAPVYHQFRVTEKFMYAFRIDEVNPDFDNFLILDDIEYRATMCSEALNTLDLGVDFYTTPMLSTLLHRHVHSATDLMCDFSKRALDCRWANLEDDYSNNNNDRPDTGDTGSTFFLNSPQNADTKWEIGLGRIDEVKFASLTNRHKPPESDLGIARLNWRNASAILVSETIHCLADSTSTVSLRYWRTGGTSLSVCVIGGYSFESIDCQRVTHTNQGYGSQDSQETDRVFIEIPRFNDPIRIALHANAQNSVGVVAIDDIRFEGRVCPNAAHSANSRLSSSGISLRHGNRAGGTPIRSYSKTPFGGSKLSNKYVDDNGRYDPSEGAPSAYSDTLSSYDSNHNPQPYGSDDDGIAHSAPDENVCRLLSCNFDMSGASQMCLYSSAMIASSAGMFTNFNNSAHAMLFERGRVAVLESVKFSLNTPARLHFDFVIKKGIAHLHVCQDSVRRELDTCYTVESTKTALGRSGLVVHDFVELLPTDTKVYIIAKLDTRSRKASVKIDNIELTDIENHKIC